MKKEKICSFCKNIIDLVSEKYVLLGTYNGLDIMDESYYHLQCFNQWYNSKVKQKAENTLKDATGKIKGIMGGFIKQAQGMSRGNQEINLSNEIPNMDKETNIEDISKEMGFDYTHR